MTTEYTLKTAVISFCERYRYFLRREWRAEISSTCLFVMLNPSRADGCKDDPTLRRCVSFARRAGHSALEVVNLFAWRSVSPKSLAEDWTRSIGPENDNHIERAAQRATVIIAAWGSNQTMGRDKSVLRMLRQTHNVFCLGTSLAGHPNHPLYLPDSTPLTLFARKEPTNGQ
jgi:hypothetical protein